HAPCFFFCDTAPAELYTLSLHDALPILRKPRMLRRCCWPTAVPMEPGDVPITPEGILAKELVPQGRLAQSSAFFRPPGTERLYSGVTIRIASESSMAFLNFLPASG